jgi:hypothetical protein
MKKFFLLAVMMVIVTIITSGQDEMRTYQKKKKSNDTFSIQLRQIHPRVTGRNLNHPELKKGEVFVTNISSEYHFDLKTKEFVPDENALMLNFNQIGWKTKRMGEVAYDVSGHKISGMRPVFRKENEPEN